jgi:hypothetical protein
MAVFWVVAPCSLVLLVSPKNNPNVNKEDGQSASAHHTIGRRPMRVCQPGAHSQEIKVKKSKAVPLHAMEAHGGRGGIAHTHS